MGSGATAPEGRASEKSAPRFSENLLSPASNSELISDTLVT